MKQLNNCPWFNHQGVEAAWVLHGVFSDSGISTHIDVDEQGEPTGEPMTVESTLDGRPFVALNGGPHFKFNEATSFQVMCVEQSEVDHYWDRLDDGWQEGQSGWLKDRFDVSRGRLFPFASVSC